MNTKYAAEAKRIFEQKPENMLVHFTSDGRPFTIKNHAENHSLTLDDKTIYTYGREDVVMTEKILNDNPDVKANGVKVGETITVGDNIPGATKAIDQVDTVLAKLHKEDLDKAAAVDALKVVEKVGGPAASEVAKVEAATTVNELSDADKAKTRADNEAKDK